jgi:hypothetical protein
MKILDLCGGTGAWSLPWKGSGYDVEIVTLPNIDVRDYIPPKNVYCVLAAPPCTEFSFAKNMHGSKCKRDFKKGLEVVGACLRIIYQCHPKVWALENPRGYLRKFLGVPKLTFDPYNYGDPYKKKTDLWGKFNLPKLNQVQPKNIKFSLMKSYEIVPEQFGILSRSERRSITPSGFANAFFEANKIELRKGGVP